MTKRNYKVTDGELTEAVRTSVSVSDVLRKIVPSPHGGSTHAHFRKRIQDLGLETGHFYNIGARKVAKITKIPAEEYLVLNRNGRRERSDKLRRAMIEYGFYYECSECGNQGMWQGKALSLEIDHKNDDCLDNRPGNLHFLCPNCHSLKSVDTGKRHVPRVKIIKPKAERKTKKPVRSKRPPKGRAHLRKVERPGPKELEILLKKSNFVQVGKMYGVSDNAVRKWLKHYRGIKTTERAKKKDLLMAVSRSESGVPRDQEVDLERPG